MIWTFSTKEEAGIQLSMIRKKKDFKNLACKLLKKDINK